MPAAARFCLFAACAAVGSLLRLEGSLLLSSSSASAPATHQLTLCKSASSGAAHPDCRLNQRPVSFLQPLCRQQRPCAQCLPGG